MTNTEARIMHARMTGEPIRIGFRWVVVHSFRWIGNGSKQTLHYTVVDA